MSDIKIMGHLVIGYPSFEESFKTACTYVENGIEILELQIPFSDPTADGVTITLANKQAIRNGISLDDCFRFIKDIREKYPNQEIYVMTYLNKIITHKWEEIENKLSQLNISQLIIPDLPFDSPESNQIESNKKIQIVPVIGVNIQEERLLQMLNKNPKFIYIMSGFKITGSSFELHQTMSKITNLIKQNSNSQIGIGFGVSSHQDAVDISNIADVVIVGSAFIEAQQENKLTEKIHEIQGRTK